MIATVVDLARPDYDRNFQSRIMCEISQSALLVVHGGISIPEAVRLLSHSGGGDWATATPTQPDLQLSNKQL